MKYLPLAIGVVGVLTGLLGPIDVIRDHQEATSVALFGVQLVLFAGLLEFWARKHLYK